jgi:hypothetical protein
MTVLRRDPGDISNYFDGLFRDIGHRGSSFTDVDGLVHDGKTGRFLFLEFKQAGEPKPSRGQAIAMLALSTLPGCEFWGLRRMPPDDVNITICQDGAPTWTGTLGESSTQTLFASWWDGATRLPSSVSVASAKCPLEDCDDPEWHCPHCGRHLADVYEICEHESEVA